MVKRALVVFALIFASISPANAEDLSYLNRTISWEDSSPLHESPVAYSVSDGAGNPCSGGWKKGCDPKTDVIEVVNFIPNCDSTEGVDKRVDCVDSVYADVNGKLVKGVKVANQNGIDDRYSFAENLDLGIAKSTAYELYTFNGLTHSKGNLFMVYPWSSRWVKQGVLGEVQYTLLIAPAFQEPTFNCAALHTANNLCWQSGSFDQDTRFTMNVRFSKVPSGWFSGRITDPELKIGTTSEGRTLMTFTGVSQSVPSINKNYHFTNQSEQDEWVQVSKNTPWQSWDVVTKDGKRYSMGTPYPSEAIKEYEGIVSRVSSFNNADKLKNVWRIDSKPGVNWETSNSNCLKPQLTGLVSSNSMTYANSIPTWDNSSKSLVYSMASPHTALGKEFIGRYDLLISESVGKCLWALNSLTPSAEISVTGSNGEKKVVTATSKIVDGFYKFTATGFTFSSNTISVKMLSEGGTPLTNNSNEKETLNNPEPIVSPSPISSVVATPVLSKKFTITCVKGKIQKKVTGVTPKCPTGYKKK